MVQISYAQWIAIFIISNLLFKPAPQSTKNDTQRPKIPRDILKDGF